VLTATATATASARASGRSVDRVTVQRHSTRQGEDSTGNTGASGNGVAYERENASHKNGVGAERCRTADLPEHIPAVALLASTTEELLAVVSVLPILKT
jgi:hypothetical protein